MARPAHVMILDAYQEVHNHILSFAESLTADQIADKSAPNGLSIAFFIWHIARWADHLQAAIPGMTGDLMQRLPPGRQIWEERGLSTAWGFAPALTGYAQTGMDMDEATAAGLAFPSKDILLDYARQVFAAAEKAIQAIDESQFMALEQPQLLTEGVFTSGETVGNAVFSHLLHDMLHFGMIQNLHGQQQNRTRVMPSYHAGSNQADHSSNKST